MSDAYFCRMEIKKFKAIWKFHLVFDVQFNIASALDPTYTIFCMVILAILYYLTVRENLRLGAEKMFKRWRFSKYRGSNYGNLLRRVR